MEISSVAFIPSITGMLISMRTISGLASLEMNKASSPFSASPITSMDFSKDNRSLIFSLVSLLSSAITTLILSISTPQILKLNSLTIVAVF
jgi:hypothetical protein